MVAIHHPRTESPRPRRCGSCGREGAAAPAARRLPRPRQEPRMRPEGRPAKQPSREGPGEERARSSTSGAQGPYGRPLSFSRSGMASLPLRRRRPRQPGPRLRYHPPQRGLLVRGRPRARHGGSFATSAMFAASAGSASAGTTIRLLKAHDFMNRSGQAVKALAAISRCRRKRCWWPTTTWTCPSGRCA